MENGAVKTRTHQTEPEDKPTKLATRIAELPYFQNVFDFVLDIGLTPKGFKVLEVNAFETSSFYAANLDNIYGAWKNSFRN